MNLTYQINGEDITFLLDGIDVGHMIFNVSNIDDIESEYSDSVDDFDSEILKKFDYGNPIVNIEDIWINSKFKGNNLFRKILELGFGILFDKYDQFILRAYSDDGFPIEKLVSIYEEFGFLSYQDTENDGVIMYRNSNMNECDCVSPNGGLTFGDVSGMGPILFPGECGERGSGDLPMPSGKVYKQVAPFDKFLKMRKKKHKKFRKEDEPCVHSENPPVYKYVDDYREYVDRTYNMINKIK